MEIRVHLAQVHPLNVCYYLKVFPTELLFGYVGRFRTNNHFVFSAAFGNFSFNTPVATTAPPAFGTPAATQAGGFGLPAPSAFGQSTFGSTSMCLF